MKINDIKKDEGIHEFIGFEYGTLFRVYDGEEAFIAMYVTDNCHDYLLDIQDGVLYSDIENYRRIEMLDANLTITDSFSS